MGDPSHVELEEALARDGHVQGELRARRGDGTVVELEVFIIRVHDPPGYVGVHRDVTERRVAELDRRRMPALVHSASDFIGMADLEGRPLFLNDAGRRMVGLDSMEAVRATAIAEFFVPEERERVVGEYLPNILAHGHQAWELTLQHFETGDRIPVSYDGFRVDDPETGEPLALATIMRDLTERRRLDTILAAVTDGIYALDVGLRFTYVNDEAIQVMAETWAGRRGEATSWAARCSTSSPASRMGWRLSTGRRWAGEPVVSSSTTSRRDAASTTAHTRWRAAGSRCTSARSPSARRPPARGSATRASRRRSSALGMRASRGEDPVALIEEVVLVASRTLDAELVAVIELLTDGRSALLRAGSGWAPGTV